MKNRFEYRLIRSQRRTLALHITREGKLEVRAPLALPLSVIEAFLEKRQDWIARKLNRLWEVAPPLAKKGEPGELWLFLGKSYPLAYRSQPQAPVLLEDSLYLSESLRDNPLPFLLSWYLAQAADIFNQRLKTIYEQIDVTPTRIRLSNSTSRWGSCSGKNSVNLAWRLVMAPPEVIDYVIFHELAHIKHHNHSAAFWAEVALHVPDYKLRRRWLRDNGNTLIL